MIRTPLGAVLVRMVILILIVIAPGAFTVAAQTFPRQSDPIDVPLTAYIANLRTVAVTIGNEPVPLEVAVKDLIDDGLLNAAFLESVVLTVDLPSGRAWAARRR